MTKNNTLRTSARYRGPANDQDTRKETSTLTSSIGCLPIHEHASRSVSPREPVQSTTSSSSSTLQILPATYDDIPELVDIHIEAYRNDVIVRLQYGDIPIAEIRKNMIAQVRELWVKNGPYERWAMKAVINGEAVGCAIWAIRDKKDKKRTVVASAADQMIGMRQAFTLSGTPVHQKAKQRTGAESERASTLETGSLREYAHGKITELHERWVNNDTRFLYLGSIAVRYSAQAHGVGSAMLHAGMQRADKEGLLIWLEATPAGHPVYEHFGWKTVDSVQIDLADFAGKDKGYGVYKYWGCIRMPLV